MLLDVRGPPGEATNDIPSQTAKGVSPAGVDSSGPRRSCVPKLRKRPVVGALSLALARGSQAGR